MLASRPKASKTIIKGTIIIAVFSIFLKINPHTIFNYLIFLIIAYFSLFLYILWKRSYTYTIAEDKIIIRSPLKRKTVKYSEISDEFISSGFLAKRFNCGSIYLISNRNSVYILRDIENPEKIENEIRKHMSNEE